MLLLPPGGVIIRRKLVELNKLLSNSWTVGGNIIWGETGKCSNTECVVDAAGPDVNK